MKRIIFSIVGSMLISICAVQAQQYDTAGTASKSRNKQQNKQRYEQSRQDRSQQSQQNRQSWQQQSDQSQGQYNYANQGMVIVDKDEIPSSLKRKLKEDKYSGWENATIYHNTNTGEYVIAPRAYRFDEQGNEIQTHNLGYGSRDGQRRYSQDQSAGQSGYPNQNNQSDQNRNDAGQSSTYGNQSQDRNNQSTQYQQRSDDQSAQDRINDQSSQNRSYDQSTETENRSYDQSTGNQNRSYDQSSGNQSGTYDQSSTTGQRSYDQSSTGQDQAGNSSAYRSGQSTQSQYETEGMVEIQSEQIPASLRRTLRGSEYSGWEERGTLYQDPTTNEYVLVMESGNNSGTSASQSQRKGYGTSQSESQTYRFDKNGQPKEDQTGESRTNRE